MSADRRCVIMAAFDLPTTDKKSRAAYRRFLKYLKSNGYVMYQCSVYIKLLHFSANALSEIRDLEQNAPADGNIFAIQLTIGQFEKIRQIRGTSFDKAWFSDDFICI